MKTSVVIVLLAMKTAMLSFGFAVGMKTSVVIVLLAMKTAMLSFGFAVEIVPSLP